MIAPEANILLYAYDEESEFHAVSARHVEEIFSGADDVGLPIQTIQAFVRLATSTGLRTGPIQPSQAFAIVHEWLALPHVHILYPGPGHLEIFERLVLATGARGRIISDIAIAAIAIEHNATVHTNDRDFARFPGVRWYNPLAL